MGEEEPAQSAGRSNPSGLLGIPVHQGLANRPGAVVVVALVVVAVARRAHAAAPLVMVALEQNVWVGGGRPRIHQRSLRHVQEPV